MDLNFSKNSEILVWSNNPESKEYKTLLSALDLICSGIQHTTEPVDACIWCLVDHIDTLDKVNNFYLRLDTKPHVLYLGTQFFASPNPDWVFFKTPVNAAVLKKWMTSRGFIKQGFLNQAKNKMSQSDSLFTKIHESVAEPRWKTRPFSLRYWPNVTNYSDSADVVHVCSYMLRHKMTYEQLQGFKIDLELIDRILAEEEKQGNLYYLDKESTQNTTADSVKSLAEQSIKATSKHSIVDGTQKKSSSKFQNKAKHDGKGIVNIGDKSNQKADDKVGWRFFQKLFRKLVN